MKGLVFASPFFIQGCQDLLYALNEALTWDDSHFCESNSLHKRMRVNLPVTQNSYIFPVDELLVSITNVKGEITHCNPAFARVSGFEYDELIGRPHNLIRHPDMPSAAFKDMWRTIGNGRPWHGMVKNRRKDGDYYWVCANVTPIMESGRPKGFLSVRSKPTQQQVEEATALYEAMRKEQDAGVERIRLEQGEVRQPGIQGLLTRISRVGTITRTSALLITTAVTTLSAPQFLGMDGVSALATQGITMALGGALLLCRLHSQVLKPLEKANDYAALISSCNLRSELNHDSSGPVGMLMARLQQIQINLQAVVGDVLAEVQDLHTLTGSLAEGSQKLSDRTNSQAAHLEETSASMTELAETIKHTATTAQLMEKHSLESKELGVTGGAAIEEVRAAMDNIQSASKRTGEIVGVIESIAFQTNLLALNAAVEAARAGEHGRGFGVVANEVRALAKRCAEAAKEINSLSENTLSGVADGHLRMTAASKALVSMIEASNGVDQLAHEINAAITAQSSGVAQVNQAVASLDLMTQQNAGLVEESTSTCTTLNTNANRLAKSVGIFRI